MRELTNRWTEGRRKSFVSVSYTFMYFLFRKANRIPDSGSGLQKQGKAKCKSYETREPKAAVKHCLKGRYVNFSNNDKYFFFLIIFGSKFLAIKTAKIFEFVTNKHMISEKKVKFSV